MSECGAASPRRGGHGERRVYERLHAAREPLVREPVVHGVVPGTAHLAPERRVGQQPHKAIGQPVAIGLLNEESGATILDDFAGGIVQRADAGQAVRHRLEVDQSKTLTAARHREDGGRAVKGVQIVLPTQTR